MNNIAEGYDRRTDKEFLQFLAFAKGSCAETRSMIILGKELGYISESDYDCLYNLTIEISKMIVGLSSRYKR